LEENKTDFPALLEEFRTLRRLNKTELAKLANLTPGYVSHLSRGERVAPSEETVLALAVALDLDSEMRTRFFEAAGYPFHSATSSYTLSKDVWNGNITRVGGNDIPDPGNFYGRQEELMTLNQWVVDDHCRVLAILGIGGIGKTSLAASLTMRIKDEFTYVFWRSLRDAPPVENILVECIQFLSNQASIDFPGDEENRLPLLLDILSEYMRKERSLIILDNFESIMQSGERAGKYRDKYDGYGRFIQRVGEANHRSCLVVTSREKPDEIAKLEGNISPVRSLTLPGLSAHDSRELIHDKGLFGSDEVWSRLIELYSGNPLALKLIAEPIREIFAGDIAAFLEEEEAVFESLRDLLEQQFLRLSEAEKVIMYWLAVEREPVSLEDLLDDILPPMTMKELVEALTSLRRRSLIDPKGTARFTLQPVIMEFMIDRLVEQVFKEIEEKKPWVFGSHALIKAYAKNYVRDGQKNFILIPLAERLRTALGREKSEQNFRSIFSALRENSPQGWEYIPGNILHLLMQLEADLRTYDFSHLCIRQAYLQGVILAEVNFSHTTFINSVFTDTFGKILSVALSPDGKLLAAGIATSEIRLWQVPSSVPLLTFQGHSDWVRSVAFSPNGKFLVSGSEDRTLRLWEVDTGRCIRTLQGHISWVYSVAFSPDGKLVASGSDDQTVRLWEVDSGNCLEILKGHSSGVYSVAFSPDGRLLASGSDDQTVRLWEVGTENCLTILRGHSDKVWSVAFSPDGRLLASGSYDQTVRLWEVDVRTCLKILRGHSDKVWSVAFSPDGRLLASGSHDQTVRLWEVDSGTCLKILKGHSSWIYSMAFSPDGGLLVSGSDDQTMRLWDVSVGECLNTLQGYSNEIWSITFSPDGKLLASGSDDHTVCLWDAKTGQALKVLRGHSNRIRCVAFSSDNKILISGSDDQTVRIWEVSTGECLNTLQGHSTWIWSVNCSLDGKLVATGSDDQMVRIWEIGTGRSLNVLDGHADWVWSVAFSPNSELLISGSDDHTVRIWEVSTGECLNILDEHTDRVRAVAFSPTGELVASGSDDQTVRLWEVNTGECLNILQGHTSWVRTVTFSPTGDLVASGSDDHTVRLWEVNTGECLMTMQGHTSRVRSVVFSPDSQMLVSGSQDGTIKFWDVHTAECLQTLRSRRPYEQMNITEVKGLSAAQKLTLKALGAIEE
jgi:WD40 repeat protein/transcriptional regulator with XRE-family HTH domain